MGGAGPNWARGLTPRQRANVHAVMRAHGDPRSFRSYGHRRAGDGPLAGWRIYRIPTTINPPTVLRCRYYDIDNELLVDVDCS